MEEVKKFHKRKKINKASRKSNGKIFLNRQIDEFRKIFSKEENHVRLEEKETFFIAANMIYTVFQPPSSIQKKIVNHFVCRMGKVWLFPFRKIHVSIFLNWNDILGLER